MEEFKLEKISIEDVRIIVAALEFYSKETEGKGKKLLIRKSGNESYQAKRVKEFIENTEVSKGITIKDSIAIYEEEIYNNLRKEGKTEEELEGAFMYPELFGI